MKIGIVQTRGIGDIVIALPIAKHLHDHGNTVYWPIDEFFLPSFKAAAPWVNWIGVSRSAPDFFLQTPMSLLLKLDVKKAVVLYSYLSSNLDLPNKLLQSALKFDQYKYAISNVPFSKKWSLGECLQRDQAREDDLFTKLVKQEKYMVIHQKGSDFSRNFNVEDAVEDGFQIIEITELTDNIFDWLKILENAKMLALVDSVFANLVEQLNIGENIPKYFGLRSDVAFTPVLKGNWQYI